MGFAVGRKNISLSFRRIARGRSRLRWSNGVLEYCSDETPSRQRSTLPFPLHLIMHQAEIIVLLFTVVAASVVIARKMALPYPVVLVLVGLALSFIPRLLE